MTEQDKRFKLFPTSNDQDLLPVMMSSPLAELPKALAKMQSELKAVPRAQENPYYKSRYADLGTIWDTIRNPLTKNGLSISQIIVPSLETAIVDTFLFHSNGEWIRSRIALKPVKGDPQGMGSAYTYARRYALSAILGVASEDDDDGNAASKGNGKGSSSAAAPSAGKPHVKQPQAKTEKQLLSITAAYQQKPGCVLFDLYGNFVDTEFEEHVKKDKTKAWMTHVKLTSGAVPIVVSLWGQLKDEVPQGTKVKMLDVQLGMVRGEKKFHASRMEVFNG